MKIGFRISLFGLCLLQVCNWQEKKQVTCSNKYESVTHEKWQRREGYSNGSLVTGSKIGKASGSHGTSAGPWAKNALGMQEWGVQGDEIQAKAQGQKTQNSAFQWGRHVPSKITVQINVWRVRMCTHFQAAQKLSQDFHSHYWLHCLSLKKERREPWETWSNE